MNIHRVLDDVDTDDINKRYIDTHTDKSRDMYRVTNNTERRYRVMDRKYKYTYRYRYRYKYIYSYR